MFMQPVPGPVSSGYGWRIRNGQRVFHNGEDHYWLFSDPTGSKRILSPTDGVVDVGYNSSAGNFVGVTASSGVRVRLCHLASFSVSQGQRVRQGQLVGIMGETGDSDSVNLHKEVWVNGARVDPAPYFTIAYNSGALAGEDGQPIETEEDEMSKPVGYYAVVDGVPSWMWVNWATGRVFPMYTQAEANHVSSYLGDATPLTDSPTATAGEKYKTIVEVAKNILGPVKPALDVATVSAAVTEAIDSALADLDVQVDGAAIALAVEQKLADDFAALSADVNKPRTLQ